MKSHLELDLLEILSGENESLEMVLKIFGATNDDAAFGRARQAVTMQI